MVYVETLVNAGVSDAAKAQLEVRLTDEFGYRNRLLETAIINRAEELRTRRVPIFAAMNRRAVRRAQRNLGQPIELFQQEIDVLESSLDALIRSTQTQPEAEDQVLQLLDELQILRRAEYLIIGL